MKTSQLPATAMHGQMPDMELVPMTDYFKNDVLAKRPYIKLEWCIKAVSNPVRRDVQAEDGRIRHWLYIEELGKFLRVVTLEDGLTLHNAFPDRRFKP